MLAIIVSQQLWLWTVVRPDTASMLVLPLFDTQLVAFVVFSFILSQHSKVEARKGGASMIESKNTTTGLLHLDQLFAHHGDGDLLVLVSQSLPREVVLSVSGRFGPTSE
jgi:hypothetical protein